MSDAPKRKITVDGADVTAHVAAMYDAIVNSLDWGSDFLDTETIESIVLIAELLGFKVPDLHTSSMPKELASPVPYPPDKLTGAAREEWHKTYAESARFALRRWREQIAAKAAALLQDAE